MLASYSRETGEIRKKASTDAAWLSSARGVSCTVKSGNERNPHRMLNNSYGTGRLLATGRRG